MPALFAQDVPEEAGRPVDDGRLAGEVRRRRHEAGHLDDLDNPAQADQRLDRGEGVQGADPGQVGALLDLVAHGDRPRTRHDGYAIQAALDKLASLTGSAS